MLTTKNTITLASSVAICFLLILSNCLLGQSISNINTGQSLFNERGTAGSNSLSGDGMVSVSDFNGNLVYQKHLHSIPTTQNGVHQSLSLTYNGSTSHSIPTGIRVSSTDNYRLNSFSSPEWILSLNSYAIQVFNFENDPIAWPSSGDTSLYNDVSMLVDGYHICNSYINGHCNISVLKEDGSIQTFIKEEASLNSVKSGLYLTFDKNDRDKAIAYRINGVDYFDIYKENGTRVVFQLYEQNWRGCSGEDDAIALLPIKFIDRFKNEVVVEYDTLFSDNTYLYGHPIVKSAGDYDFNWGGLLTNGGNSNTVTISTDHDGTIYTINMYNFENLTQISSPSNSGNDNRSLITQITDKMNRAEEFYYLPYCRSATRICIGPNGVEDCSNRQNAIHYRVKPWRLSQLENTRGGIYRYTYLEDDNSNWESPANYNSLSVVVTDSIPIDLWPSESGDCGNHRNYPCYQSSEFLNYGRDPFYSNMLSAISRLLVMGTDTSLISHDSIYYTWVNDSFPDYLSANLDTLITLHYYDSIGYDATNNPCGGKTLDSISYTYITDISPFAEYTISDRGWHCQIETNATKNVTNTIDGCDCDELGRTKYFWHDNDYSLRKTLDSVEITEDGVSSTIRYSYEYVKGSYNLDPDDVDTCINLISQSTIDPFGIINTTFYNSNYFDLSDSGDFYSNAITCSVQVYDSTNLLDKYYYEFYGDSSDSGFIGQLKSENQLVLEDGAAKDTLSTFFQYYLTPIRDIDRGALKKLTYANNAEETYSYYDYVGDTTQLDTVSTVSVTCGMDQTERDSVIVSDWSLVKYSLRIADSNEHPSTYVKVFLNNSMVKNFIPCGDYVCTVNGTFEANATDIVKIVVCGGKNDNSEVTVRGTAWICEYLDTLVNPVTYMKCYDDGDIEENTIELENTGPFWYKRTKHLKKLLLEEYRCTDIEGLNTFSVDYNDFITNYFYDDIDRFERVILPYSYSASKAEPNYYSLKNNYNDSPSSGFGAECGAVLTSTMEQDVSTNLNLNSRQQYDKFNRLYQTDSYYDYSSGDYDSIQNHYNYLDYHTKSIDELGHATITMYDDLGRLVYKVFPDSASSENIYIQKQYSGTDVSSLGLDTLTEPGGFLYHMPNTQLFQTITIDENDNQVIEYFDVMGNLRLERRFIGTTELNTLFDYDEFGNNTLVIKPEEDEVHYMYNNMGWLLKEWSADYDTLFYKYDNLGRLIAMKDGNLTSLEDDTLTYWNYYDYDEVGRIETSGLMVIDSNSITDFDTSITVINEYYYDQDAQENSYSLTSLAYTNENGYNYGEEYHYNARERLIKQINHFEPDLDSTVLDSVYMRLHREVKTDTVQLNIENNGYAHYDLSRCATGNPSSYILVLLNDTQVIASLYFHSGIYCDTIVNDSFNVSAGDNVKIIAQIVASDVSYATLTGKVYYERYDDPQKAFVNGQEYEISYEYNNADQLTELTYPNGMIVTYEYDDLGRIIAVGDDTETDKYASITYTSRGEVEKLVLGPDMLTGPSNLQEIDYDYNARGWLNSVNSGSSSASAPNDLFGEQLFYYGHSDSTTWPSYYNGNIGGQFLDILGSTTHAYSYYYDDVNRLVDARYETNVIGLLDERFTYDKNGNILSRKYGGLILDTLTLHYTSNTNLLSSYVTGAGRFAHTSVISHDAYGNIAFDSGRGVEYKYDIFNQLDTAKFYPEYEERLDLAFGYNTDELRIYKDYHFTYLDSCDGGSGGSSSASGGESTGFELDSPLEGGMMESGGDSLCRYYDNTKTIYIRENPGGKVLAEYDDKSDSLLYTYIYAGSQRIAMRDRNGTLHFYMYDHLGSTRLVLDSLGIVNDTYSRYYAFGDAASQSVSTNQKYRYTSKPYDDEGPFDLYYYGARYYDPVLGRFISIDQMRHIYPGQNAYQYALNNPIKNTDPDGQIVVTGAAVGAGVVLVAGAATIGVIGYTVDPQFRQAVDMVASHLWNKLFETAPADVEPVPIPAETETADESGGSTTADPGGTDDPTTVVPPVAPSNTTDDTSDKSKSDVKSSGGTTQGSTGSATAGEKTDQGHDRPKQSKGSKKKTNNKHTKKRSGDQSKAQKSEKWKKWNEAKSKAKAAGKKAEKAARKAAKKAKDKAAREAAKTDG